VSPRDSRSKGASGEEIAAKYLIKKGFKILEKNYNTRLGEIDIIALDKKTVVFIEVKTATQKGFGDPINWVPPRKQVRIIRTSQVYMKNHGTTETLMRFDVVAIDADMRVNHVRDAFRSESQFFM